MKYSKILLGAFIFCGLGVFSSCDVNDEFYDELDKSNEPTFVKELEYSFVEKDYGFYASEEDEVKNGIAKNKNFSATTTAEKYMPAFLADRYPYLEKGSMITVTYDYYQGGPSYLYDLVEFQDKLDALEEAYELESADYDAMGVEKGEPGYYNNFDKNMDVPAYLAAFLESKYPDAVEGFMVSITYKFYSGSTSNINEVWAFDGTKWEKASPEVPEGIDICELTSADYDSMGAPGSNDNFSSSLPASNYLPRFLSIKNPYAQAGDKIAVIYRYYKGKIDNVHTTVWEAKEYTYDGNVWNAYSKVIKNTDQFEFDGKKWNLIVITPYTFTDDDYELTGDSQYKNFGYYDNEAGVYKEVEVENVLQAKINDILTTRFPDAEENALFLVTYDYYSNGSTNAVSVKYVKKGDGFVPVEE